MDQGKIALVALVISVLLAVVRIYEFARSRWWRGLSVKSALTSLPEIGNDVIILNASATPANIYYFDLVWVPRSLGFRMRIFRKIVRDESPLEADYCNITVSPHGQATLPFSEADHFAWGVRLKEDIYLRLWLVGRRKPVWFWITGPET